MFIVELSQCGSVTVCRPNGTRISAKSTLGQDILDCTAGGDCEPACRYILSRHKPQFRIVKEINGTYQNVLASHDDKIELCKEIYFESERDWAESEEWCEVYLIWQAASDFETVS